MKLFKDMDEPELRAFFKDLVGDLVGAVKSGLPEDVEGFMVVVTTEPYPAGGTKSAIYVLAHERDE